MRLGRARLDQTGVLALGDQGVDGARFPSGGEHEVGLRTRDHALGGGRVDRAVQRDDATERGALVALERALVRGGEIVGEGDAAGIGVLDDRDRRSASSIDGQVVHEVPRCVGVVEVEVGERQARRAAARRPTSCSCPRCGSAPRAGAGSRRSATLHRCARARGRCTWEGPRRVASTRRSVRRRRPCSANAAIAKRAPGVVADRVVVGVELLEQRRVLRRLGDDGDERMVLRRRAHHRGTADVDGLDVGALRERVEVRHDEVERLDAVGGHVVVVGRLRAVGEDAAVDLRVQRDDPMVEDRWHAGDVVDRGDRDAGVGDGLGRAARRDELDAASLELAGELDDAGLVVHREQRPRDLRAHHSTNFRSTSG